MTIELSLRVFDAAIADAYARLFPDDPGKTPADLTWRSAGNPHGRSKFVVATDGGAVVGMIALVPTRMADGTAAFQAIDTIVDPAYQGRALFVRLGKLAQETLDADILWGFPNANAKRGWYGRLGWTDFGEVPLLIRPLRSTFLFARVHPRLRKIDVPLIGWPSRTLMLIADGEQLARKFDPLWYRVRAIFGNAVDRSGEWLRWRLLEKPGADYRCVGVTAADGSLTAFVASRIAEKHGSRLCYVMEALGLPGEERELAATIRSELALAARKGAEAALAWCPRHAPNYRAYRKAGFVPFPPRLRPVEINFGARALRPGGAAATAADAKWYVSFLDSDTN